jgi:hypothetical protein
MSSTLVFAPRGTPVIAWPLLCLVMIGCQPSGFVVRAPKTTLGVGESVQLEVFKRGPWFFDMQRLEPQSLVWRTSGESVLVPEPDGRLTCVGTAGRENESAIISAASGLRRGWRRFHVTRAGPGPTLDFVTRGSISPCPQLSTERCTVMHEGDSIRFQVIRKRGRGAPDVTARSAGTQYLVFVGSGLANDPAPQIIIGEPWPPNLNAASIRIDDARGVITAPDIGSLNWFAVMILARNDDSVGWLFLQIEHRKAG